jgi:hypothetical protein
VALQGLLILGDRLLFKKLVFQNPKDSHDCAVTIANIWSYYKVFKKLNGNKKIDQTELNYYSPGGYRRNDVLP